MVNSNIATMKYLCAIWYGVTMLGEKSFEIMMFEEKKSTTPEICKVKKFIPMVNSSFAAASLTYLTEGLRCLYFQQNVMG